MPIVAIDAVLEDDELGPHIQPAHGGGGPLERWLHRAGARRRDADSRSYQHSLPPASRRLQILLLRWLHRS
jgi:hypothetical protein